MGIKQTIANNAKQPITHQLLKSWLKAYKRPNDKINSLKWIKQNNCGGVKKVFVLH
jgi:hypothetical protein